MQVPSWPRIMRAVGPGPRNFARNQGDGTSGFSRNLSTATGGPRRQAGKSVPPALRTGREVRTYVQHKQVGVAHARVGLMTLALCAERGRPSPRNGAPPLPPRRPPAAGGPGQLARLAPPGGSSPGPRALTRGQGVVPFFLFLQRRRRRRYAVTRR